MNQHGRFFPLLLLSLCLGLLIQGCAKDRYQQRADRIKEHTETFFEHLKAGRSAEAVLENERIEAIGQETERALLRHAGQYDGNRKIQEWSSIKTAYETAAENWLTLARYFIQKKQYQKAQGTYQRVIESYRDEPYKTYVFRAQSGLRDIELILNPT